MVELIIESVAVVIIAKEMVERIIEAVTVTQYTVVVNSSTVVVVVVLVSLKKVVYNYSVS